MREVRTGQFLERNCLRDLTASALQQSKDLRSNKKDSFSLLGAWQEGSILLFATSDDSLVPEPTAFGDNQDSSFIPSLRNPQEWFLSFLKSLPRLLIAFRSRIFSLGLATFGEARRKLQERETTVGVGDGTLEGCVLLATKLLSGNYSEAAISLACECLFLKSSEELPSLSLRTLKPSSNWARTTHQSPISQTTTPITVSSGGARRDLMQRAKNPTPSSLKIPCQSTSFSFDSS